MDAVKKRKCAADLLEHAKRLAHKQQGLPYEPPEKQKTGPLVPVYIGLDAQTGEFREQLLWKMEEKEITTAAAAARLCHELCLPAAQFEKFIEQQMDVGIKHHKNWKRFDGERVVKLKVAVKRGDKLFRDIVLWDLSNPHNTAAFYASITCNDMALDHPWYEAIQHRVQQLIDDLRYELHNFPEEVKLEQPCAQPFQPETGASEESGFPRVEAYDAALDWYIEYQQRRKEKMKLPGRQYPEPRQREHIPELAVQVQDLPRHAQPRASQQQQQQQKKQQATAARPQGAAKPTPQLPATPAPARATAAQPNESTASAAARSIISTAAGLDVSTLSASAISTGRPTEQIKLPEASQQAGLAQPASSQPAATPTAASSPVQQQSEDQQQQQQDEQPEQQGELEIEQLASAIDQQLAEAEEDQDGTVMPSDAQDDDEHETDEYEDEEEDEGEDGEEDEQGSDEDMPDL